MEIPYTVTERHDTGLTNGRFGIWLFLASEVMFFGGVFSSYLVLRVNAGEWPRGADRLNVVLGATNSLILVLSSITVLAAWGALRENQDLGRARRWLGATIFLGVVFLAIKASEWQHKLDEGIRPATDIFYALYFTMTGLHVIHLAAGLVVLAYLAGPGAGLHRRAPRQYAQRVEVTGIYWHFVDLVWIVLFPTLYLT